MSVVELCVLASGSAGNCTALRTPGGVMLVDAGIGPRVAAQRLNGSHVSVADVTAICLTHLDRDHFNFNWLGTIFRHQIRVFCHASRFDDLMRCVESAAETSQEAERFASHVWTFDADEFEPLPGLSARAVALAHDHSGSHGFCLDGFGSRIGYVTDLGCVPEHLFDCFDNLDVLAIESNYDPDMQRRSPRPWFLKQRIMGGRGHLSNEQALDAVRRILSRAQSKGAALPAHVVLLHRSRQCNCPDLVRALFSRDSRVPPRLTLAEQFEPSPWLGARREAPFVGEQLALAWG